MYSDLFKHILTTADAEKLQESIDIYIGLLYQTTTDTTYDGLLDEAFSPSIASMLRESIKKAAHDSSAEAIRTFFITLSEELKKLDIIRVTVAIPPREDIIQHIATWMQEQFPGQPVLLDITVDPAILGGLVVIYKGNYLDLSLKKQVEEWFANKDEQVRAGLS